MPRKNDDMTSRCSTKLNLPSADATNKFARSIAPHLVPGDTLLLSGELGSGKTHFVRALIQARLAESGQEVDIPSPTYTLVQPYHDGICEIWHADLYRLTNTEEVIELGLIDAMEDSICLIEWPDRLGELTPKFALDITFSYADDPESRRVTLIWRASRWDKLRALFGDINV